MNIQKSLLTATLLTLGGFAAMTGANASGTQESTFKIETKITSVCTIDASGAAITLTDIAADTAALDTSISNKTGGDIKVNCSKSTPYTINLKTAGNLTSTTGEGVMKGTGEKPDTITYKLFSDSTGTAVWGNTEDNAVKGTGTGLSTQFSHPVYASITGSTDVKQDTYTDTITATVTY